MDVSKIAYSRAYSRRAGLGWGSLATVLASVVVGLAIAAPSFAQSVISLDRYFRPDPKKFMGNGGGNISLAQIANIADNCRGFTSAAPNHTITLSEDFPVLDLLAYSDNINDSLTMLVKGSDGTIFCAGDGSGSHPQINSRFHKGDYQVWVGSTNINQSFRYTLSLSETHQK